MEPNIALERSFKREQIVLQVVLACKHLKTVAGTVMEGLGLHRFSAQFFVSRLLVRQHACLRQLFAQLGKVTFGFRLA